MSGIRKREFHQRLLSAPVLVDRAPKVSPSPKCRTFHILTSRAAYRPTLIALTTATNGTCTYTCRITKLKPDINRGSPLSHGFRSSHSSTQSASPSLGYDLNSTGPETAIFRNHPRFYSIRPSKSLSTSQWNNTPNLRLYSSSSSSPSPLTSDDTAAPEKMVANRIDGTAIAKSIRERLKAEIAEKQQSNPRYQPCLKIIQGKLSRLDHKLRNSGRMANHLVLR